MIKTKSTELELAEAAFVSEYCSEFLTKEEDLARWIRFIELKMPLDKIGPSSKKHRDLLMANMEKRYNRAEIALAREILNRGMTELSMELRKRVLHAAPQLIARCRKCKGVLRTPEARQCRWCGYDWHHSAV